MAEKQLIVAVESTAAMGPYWNTILMDYLDKMIRFSFSSLLCRFFLSILILILIFLFFFVLKFFNLIKIRDFFLFFFLFFLVCWGWGVQVLVLILMLVKPLVLVWLLLVDCCWFWKIHKWEKWEKKTQMLLPLMKPCFLFFDVLFVFEIWGCVLRRCCVGEVGWEF